MGPGSGRSSGQRMANYSGIPFSQEILDKDPDRYKFMGLREAVRFAGWADKITVHGCKQSDITQTRIIGSAPVLSKIDKKINMQKEEKCFKKESIRDWAMNLQKDKFSIWVLKDSLIRIIPVVF